MENIVLNVYDDDDNIIKTVEATDATIKFGLVRKLMKLLNIDEMEDTHEILLVVMDSWDIVTALLGKFFPDMTDDDWDNVKIDELIPAVLALLKSSFVETLKIPKDPN